MFFLLTKNKWNYKVSESETAWDWQPVGLGRISVDPIAPVDDTMQDTGAPVLEGSRGSEVITVTTPMEEWCLAAESRNFGGRGLFSRKLAND